MKRTIRTVHRWGSRRPLLAAAMSMLVALPGCFSYSPADGPAAAPQPLAADALALRASEDESAALRAEHAATPLGVVRPLALAAGAEVDEAAAARARAKAERAAYEIVSSELVRGGLLRRWKPRYPDDEWAIDHPAFRRLTIWDEPDERVIDIVFNASFHSPAGLSRRLATEAAVAAVDAEYGGPPSYELPRPPLVATEHYALVDRLEFAGGVEMFLPEEAADDARGLVIYLPAMFANVYEYRVISELRERGWAVMAVNVEVRTPSPNEVERRATERRRSYEVRRRHEAELEAAREAAEAGRTDVPTRVGAGRVFELDKIVREEAPDPPTGFRHEAGVDVDELAGVIARAVDGVIRENAVAALAGVEATLERLPQLRGKPIAVVGFSAGSFAAPAVAAALDERFPEAAIPLVLVGGGGDVLSVAMDSTLTNGGLDVVEKGERLPESVRDSLVEAYRGRSQLDPLRSMAALRDRPALVVIGKRDRMVPTEAGRALAAAHGGADRLMFSGKHMELFFFLPGQRGRIVRWIERAAGLGD